MTATTLLYPTATLVALTFVVSLALVSYRFYLVRTGQVNAGYFKLNRGGRPPKRHDALHDNYNNLFQVPVLYYAVVAIAIATGHSDPTLLTLAWAFVGFRILHTLVHVFYNNVLHRLLVFFLAYASVIAMWIQLLSDILPAGGPGS